MDKQYKYLRLCGFFGLISFLSYLIAVIFSPLAYPGYDWMSQAVSVLSATGFNAVLGTYMVRNKF